MRRGFLLDEHFRKWWRHVLSELATEADLLWVGGEGAPALGTKDPRLLIWLEEADRYLITHNRRSMPRHLRAHNAAGRHVPGIFKIHPDTNVHVLAGDLRLVLFASWPDEFRDRIVRLPFQRKADAVERCRSFLPSIGAGGIA